MIQLRIEKQPSGRITSFEMSGHADYAEHGKDLVCAAASAVSFGAVNALIALTGITPVIEQGDQGGYLKVVLPETGDDHDQQVIMRAMIVSMETIEQDYGQFIQVSYQ
ncbi:ribosomal-processing cysteine protease Prp [Sporosarcina trichiuri]|uniref:ribosomal-processing cysteine protease Prp n=1 Tax=Sporosarcina trichiuri TaxID=3056445 RepID=UPI0025B281FE|nr:ribosomal-processing cysteine protease Prp [Sporosarcina sp. 0.2-SM1T-5]WJY28188.1 ribosomal-processing cysteine protease Prp [Sporosarcina sp. 0.2-SM1T-5]